MATRRGSAEWKGDLKGGAGEVTVGDAVFRGQYPFASRFEGGDGTNPEELIGAAHAACYAMRSPRRCRKAATCRACPVSRTLAGVLEINLKASLA